MENVPPYWADPPSSKCGGAEAGDAVFDTFENLRNDGDPSNNVRINTVALGPDSNPGLMSQIATSMDGTPSIVDVAPSPENASLWFDRLDRMVLGTPTPAYAQQALPPGALENRLANVYEHHHNGASYQQRLWQMTHITTGRQSKPVSSTDSATSAVPSAVMAPSATGIAPLQPRGDVITVPMQPGLEYATLSVNWPSGVAPVTVVPPAGQDLSKIDVVRSDSNTVFQIDDPAPGDWLIGLPHIKGTEVMLTLSGISVEMGFARAVVGVDSYSVPGRSYLARRMPAPGESVPIVLALVGEAAVTNATVVAVANGQGGQQQTFSLLDDGAGRDRRAGDGIYSGVLTETTQGGAFWITVAAQWTGADSLVRERIYPVTVAMTELDSDNDGISDIDEIVLGLDPKNPRDAFEDQDGDGLPTWQEVEIGLDPLNPDTDGGGANDGDELRGALDPEDPTDDERIGDDGDGDGMSDACEERWRLDPNDPTDADKDSDGDGLTNREECTAGTSPLERDTDADGTPDAEDKHPTDPLDRDGPTSPVEPGEEEEKDLITLLCWILLIICLVLLILLMIQRRTMRRSHTH